MMEFEGRARELFGIWLRRSEFILLTSSISWSARKIKSNKQFFYTRGKLTKIKRRLDKTSFFPCFLSSAQIHHHTNVPTHQLFFLFYSLSLLRGAHRIMSSTRRISSAASDAERSTCFLSLKDSVIPSFDTSATLALTMSKSERVM